MALSSSTQVPALLLIGQLGLLLLLGLPIARIDLREHRIPNRLSAALATSLVFTSLLANLLGNGAIKAPAWAGVEFAALLLLCRLLVPGSVGAGDIKLAFSIGWVSYQFPLTVTLGIACLGGLLFWIARGRFHPAGIPFAPFLLLAGALSLSTSLFLVK